MRHTLYKTLAALLIGIFTLSGCGGGVSATAGGSSTSTGKFVDATVVGIPYKCGTSTAVSGVTNATGEFTCATGEAVAFYVGDILIGSISSPSAVVTPMDLVGAGATPSNTTVANIVRFLMSISSTDPATGTITIDPAVVTAAAGKSLNFATTAGAALDTLVGVVKPGATVYTTTQAATHMGSTINGLFAGSYAGSYSGNASGTWSLTINSSGTVSGTTSDGSIVTGTMSTTLSTGSTYGFSGDASGTPWTGTLNVSTKVFSGTWGSSGFSGTWTGTQSSAAGQTPPPSSTPGLTFSSAIAGVSTYANSTPSVVNSGTNKTYTYSSSSGGTWQIIYAPVGQTADFQVALIYADASSASYNYGLTANGNQCTTGGNVGVVALCSNIGVTFDKTAGTIRFATTPIGPRISGNTTSTTATVSGTLTFPPF